MHLQNKYNAYFPRHLPSTSHLRNATSFMYSINVQVLQQNVILHVLCIQSSVPNTKGKTHQKVLYASVSDTCIDEVNSYAEI